MAVLAVAWTWPGLVTPDLLSVHSDVYGTAWFVGSAGRLFPGFVDPLAAWPEGATYGRPDSWTLALLGWLLPLGAAKLHALVGVVGVWLSGWAAAAFAEDLGAKAPWSWLAGSAFACSGLAATALLEGYSYHLLDPWLPLCALFWLRACRGGGAKEGALAGLFFLLTLLTTAYLGVAASLVLACFALAAGRELSPKAVGGLVGVVTLPLGLYVYAFLNAPGDPGSTMGGLGRVLDTLFLNLSRAVGATVETDHSERHATLALLGAVPALAVLAPRVLGSRRKAPLTLRALGLAGVVSLVIALAPRFDPSPLAGLPVVGRAAELLGHALLRFPERFAWSWYLCGGVLAALVLERIARKHRRAALVLLVAGFVDAFWIVGLPFRQGTLPSGVPSAYQGGDGPVFDLWPEDPHEGTGWALRATSTDCWYQLEHGRAIGDHCVTPAYESPRLALTPWVLEQALEGRVGEAADQLAAFGYEHLVLHTDPFHPADRARLEHALAHVDPDPVESRDGGERVLAYRLPPAGDDPAGAWAAW